MSVLFPFHGIPFIDKGYFLEERLLFLAKVFFISCFLRLQLLCSSGEGALEFFLGLG
jgi:hypothetical protein